MSSYRRVASSDGVRLKEFPRVSSDDWAGLLPILVLGVLAWFLFIRPARRRAQDVQKLQNQLSTGDDVMLTSGFFGRVTDIDGERIQVELAPGMVVTVHRGAIGKIVNDVPPAEPGGDDHDEAPYEQASYDEAPADDRAETPADTPDGPAPDAESKPREAN
jgi:preprotein translocase subunit YajC